MERWTFKREISIPDVLAIVTAIVFSMGAYYTTKNEIELLKIKQDALEQSIKDAKEDTRMVKQEIREDIREIKNTLQRIVEKK